MNEKPKEPERRAEDLPVTWFCVLERARQTNDFETAAKARQELERLGVTVKYATGRKAVRNARRPGW
jgi:hypothetical protein